MFRPLIWPADETEDQKRIRYLEDRVNFLEQNARVRLGNIDTLTHDDLGNINWAHTHSEVDVIETNYLVVDQGGLGDFTSIGAAITYIRQHSAATSTWKVQVRSGTYAESLALGSAIADYASINFIAEGVVIVQPTADAATISGTFARVRFDGFDIYQTTAASPSHHVLEPTGTLEFHWCRFFRTGGTNRTVIRQGKIFCYHCRFEEAGVGSSSISFTGDGGGTDAGDTVDLYECVLAGNTTTYVVENWLGQNITLYNCRVTQAGSGGSIESNTSGGGSVAVGRSLYDTTATSGTLTFLDGDAAFVAAPSPHDIVGSEHTVTGAAYQIVGLTAINTLGLLTPSSTVGVNTIPIGGAGGAITWSGSQTFSAQIGVGTSPATNVGAYIFRSASVDPSSLYGTFTQVTASGTYATGDVVALQATAGTSDAAITVATLTGIRISVSKESTDTVTTARGLVIDDMTDGAVNYAIYTGTGLIRFGDGATAVTISLTKDTGQVVFNSATIAGTLTWTPASVPRTITLPDATGTVPLGTGTATRVAYWSATNVLTSDADLTFDGSSLTIGGRLGLDGGAVSATNSLTASATRTTTSGTEVGANFAVFGNPGSASSAMYFGGTYTARSTAANAQNFTGAIYGLAFDARHQGTATASQVGGLRTQVGNTSTGTITDAIGARILANYNTGGGSIGTNYGIWVENQTAGSTDYGIYIAGADTYALFVDAGLVRFDGNGTHIFEFPADATAGVDTTIDGRVPIKIGAATKYFRYYND